LGRVSKIGPCFGGLFENGFTTTPQKKTVLKWQNADSDSAGDFRISSFNHPCKTPSLFLLIVFPLDTRVFFAEKAHYLKSLINTM